MVETARLAWTVFAVPAERLGTLGTLLAAATVIPVRDGPEVSLAVAVPDGDVAAAVRLACGLGLGHALARYGPDALGLCGSDTCDQPLVRKGQRHWCSLRCANRGRVARHRGRR